MASRDENGVYWMNAHDAAKQLMSRGVPYNTRDVISRIQRGLIHASKEQRIDGRQRWRISSVEIDKIVKDYNEGVEL